MIDEQPSLKLTLLTMSTMKSFSLKLRLSTVLSSERILPEGVATEGRRYDGQCVCVRKGGRRGNIRGCAFGAGTARVRRLHSPA